MGCICSKRTSAHEFLYRTHGTNKDLKASKCSKHLGPSLIGEETIVEGNGVGNDATARLISDPSREGKTSSGTNSSDDRENKTDIIVKTSKTPTQRNLNTHSGSIREQGQPRIASLTRGERGAQIVAGWPSWLVSVAGEAISGWVPRKADSFERMDKIGQGTYSNVYRARDLETNKIVALKKVRFANLDPESVRFMAREIIVLRRLDHPNVMKLEGLITSRVSGSLYLVFDYMEHDLAGLAAKPGIKFTEAQIKCYMQQLLLGLEHCHNHGIIHRDIKGSNLLIDNNGKLKIGDFGLATFFQSSQTQPLTSRVVTLWYRPPELLLGATKYGVSVDLWSSGCILAELFTGKPIMPGRTEVEQLHKIFKLCGSPSEEYWKRSKLPHSTIFKPQHPYNRCVAETFKDLPSSALSLLEVLLAVEPECRGTASLALQNEFFTTEPLACAPSSLPKYPPSKELDTKFRNEESKRRRTAAAAGREQESIGSSMKESRAIPAPHANAELQSSILKRQGLGNLKSVSEQFNPEEKSHNIFSIEAPSGASATALSGFCHSGQSMHSNAFGTSQNMDLSRAFTEIGQTESVRNGAEFKKQRSYQHLGAPHLSRFSNSVAIRGDSQYDINGDSSVRFLPNYNHEDETSENLLDRTNLSNKKHGQPHVKNPAVSYAAKNNRMHFSGPLMPSGGNVEEMLKEHERQIQNAVRKARADKVKPKKASDELGQTESLLHFVQNHR